MRTNTESFVSQVILSQTYNPTKTDGDVDSPTGFFGYATFGPNEFIVDGMDTPTEFLGRTVTASENELGFIVYDVLSPERLKSAGYEDPDLNKLAEILAEQWFEEKQHFFGEWSDWPETTRYLAEQWED